MHYSFFSKMNFKLCDFTRKCVIFLSRFSIIRALWMRCQCHLIVHPSDLSKEGIGRCIHRLYKSRSLSSKWRIYCSAALYYDQSISHFLTFWPSIFLGFFYRIFHMKISSPFISTDISNFDMNWLQYTLDLKEELKLILLTLEQGFQLSIILMLDSSLFSQQYFSISAHCVNLHFHYVVKKPSQKCSK